MTYSKTRIKIIKKVCNTYTCTEYYPQYFKNPIIFFGFEFCKGKWKNFKELTYDTTTYSTVFFSNIEETQYFLNSKIALGKIEYVTYP